MPKTATLADIAKKSRVSVSTGSLVLRDKPGIPDGTRQRVMAAAQALNYPLKRRQPDSAITSGTPKKLSTLGLILKADDDHPARANPFYSHVLVGIEEARRRGHVNMLYATMPVDPDNVPIEIPRLDEYDSVLTDNARGEYMAVSYLIERGHKHIAFVGAHPNAYPSWQLRRNAYESALADHSLRHRYYGDVIFRQEVDGAVKKLLTDHPQIRALACVNDTRNCRYGSFVVNRYLASNTY